MYVGLYVYVCIQPQRTMTAHNSLTFYGSKFRQNEYEVESSSVAKHDM